MAALREHAQPGRRAYLIEQAWNAGEHSIVALADAARVARGTVYADLETRGINPRTARQEDHTLKPITVNGYTGSESDAELLERITTDLRTRFRHLPETDENRQAAGSEYEKHLASHAAAKYHNALIPAATKVENAASTMHRRVQVAETAWNELSTATAWHAAHHRWVVAASAAAQAIEDWGTAGGELASRAEAVQQQYGPGQLTRWYSEHVPADQQITVSVRYRFRMVADEFACEQRKRRAIAAQTLQASAR